MQGMQIIKGKLSTKNLKRLCEKHTTDEKVLVVHSQDVPFEEFYSNTYTVTSSKGANADLHVDPYYKELSNIESSQYNFILCTGLLEHIPDPQRLIDDFHRILKPGGKLVITASAISSFHEGPDDYFRYTPYGLKLLFAEWDNFEIEGSCKPFETISILLQRILLQCKIKPKGMALLVEMLCLVLPQLDRFVKQQHFTRHPQNKKTEIDSMMPYEVFAVAFKPGQASM